MSAQGDEHWMAIALDEAARGLGTTRPNPMVGAVVVRDGVEMGRGFHARAGEPHAEVIALAAAGAHARGAELFVSLEPCSHHGRTPPCVDAILAAGVRRVVAGMIDPNPLVSGRGVGRLRDAGVEVRVGVLEERCRALNEAFSVWVSLRRPFVTVKLAVSLDGRIATRTGDSRWISCEASRQRAHAMRAASDAVLVGTGTLLRDNPSLTVRHVPIGAGGAPRRWIIDPALSAPAGSACLDTGAPTTVATIPGSSAVRRSELAAAGVEVVELPPDERGVDLAALLSAMAAREHQALLVEGGGRLVGSLLERDLVDRLVLFVAPLLIGADGLPSVTGMGPERIELARRARSLCCEPVGSDVMLVAELR